ncbi:MULTISPECIES: putative immunity/bacteriocin fusion bifunctional protein [unclassified Exiguobacterium]|uniref:putative immunity/bacteriocin fusion bifunctional protein n=1 Tax=unclassified Exiguobacterium TaxID=2644629 RepID=UPI001BEC6AD3|nr:MULTISPECIES: putative immunity/bacteriocin fusion bifunctional protein [unclassified Exiguobacterium]
MTKLSRSFFKGEKFKLIMLLTMILVLLSNPNSISASSNLEEDCGCGSEGVNLEYTEIQGKEKRVALTGLEESSIFEKNVDHKSINFKKSKVLNLGKNDYANGDVLQITTLFENSKRELNYDLLTAHIEKDSKKILKLTYVKVNTDTVMYKDFDENGTLMIHQEFNTTDFLNGNLENGTTYYSVYENQTKGFAPQEVSAKAVDTSSYWYKFACSFSGIAACGAGCVASFASGPFGAALYGICTNACSLFWGTAIC